MRRNLVGSDLTIVTASAFHLYEATIFLITDKANGSIGMSSFLAVFHSPRIAALALFTGCLSAGIGQWVKGLSPPCRFLFLMPQLTLFMITSLGALYYMIVQHYADFVPRSFFFISADQGPRLLMSFLYGVAIYARVSVRPRFGTPAR